MKSKMSPVRARELQHEKNRTQIDGVGDYVDYASGYAVAERGDVYLYLVQMAAKPGRSNEQALALLNVAESIRRGKHEGRVAQLIKKYPLEHLVQFEEIMARARANAGFRE